MKKLNHTRITSLGNQKKEGSDKPKTYYTSYRIPAVYAKARKAICSNKHIKIPDETLANYDIHYASNLSIIEYEFAKKENKTIKKLFAQDDIMLLKYHCLTNFYVLFFTNNIILHCEYMIKGERHFRLINNLKCIYNKVIDPKQIDFKTQQYIDDIVKAQDEYDEGI